MVDGPLPSDEIEPEFLVRCKSRLRGHPMATTSIGRSQQGISSGKDVIGFAEAMGRLSREERFRATV